MNENSNLKFQNVEIYLSFHYDVTSLKSLCLKRSKLFLFTKLYLLLRLLGRFLSAKFSVFVCLLCVVSFLVRFQMSSSTLQTTPRCPMWPAAATTNRLGALLLSLILTADAVSATNCFDPATDCDLPRVRFSGTPAPQQRRQGIKISNEKDQDEMRRWLGHIEPGNAPPQPNLDLDLEDTPAMNDASRPNHGDSDEFR